MIPSCRIASELLSQGLDRPLRAREALALRFHLVLCASCRRVQGQLEFIREALRRYARREGPA
jgi:hypothetical protein